VDLLHVNTKKFFLDALGAAALCAILLIEALAKKLPFGAATWLSVGMIVVTVPLMTQFIAVRKAKLGGWTFVLLAYALIYFGAVHPYSWAPVDLWSAYLRRANDVYPIMIRDAQAFGPIYILIASAAFTLTGLFFIVVRRVSNAFVASRLVAIAEIFGVAFLMSVPMLFFPDEPWWRLAFASSSSTALFYLLRDPNPYPIDFRNDAPPIIYFWNEWLKSRRGTAMYALFGMSIIPAWPVLGEFLLVTGLFTVLYMATRAATFLYISTEVRGDPDGTTVANLFWVRVPPRALKQIQEWKAGYPTWEVAPPGADHVVFMPGQPKIGDQ
jgi:hypothetical protein